MNVEASQALFDAAAPLSDERLANLPPALAKHHRQARAATNQVTDDQIAQMQVLRNQDPYTNTAGHLAKEFGCSPTFVSIVAPAPKSVRQAREAESDLKKATWGMNKRISRAQRAERRALW